ncbi:uncharacterized protein LOC109006791 isoform X2 [Juglans regia]|uniref:Uncharacterized protein LOC109006791 isoform X2 n=1 Tax=Juglans regia TaxID=51240 RepID=A0A6P9EQZ3_JUGRE|nr:uncharacterized protein LOC109006791 isoform X2 [Juglans regia]
MPLAAAPRRDRTQALWRVRLGSALRTILACTIVACTTLYGPAPLRHLLTYPAFSYVTTILIVSDATLGDALRGFWHALFATVQVLILSVLSLWIVGPARFTNGLAAVAVAINAFLVAVPESTPLISKRIAFGQIVIVYVGAVVQGAQTGSFMHPVHVASSTALGALASVLAMLFPYPHLAYFVERKTRLLYAENGLERLKNLLDAFFAQNNAAMLDPIISQAKFLSKTGAKLLQRIQDNKEGVLWERPQRKFLKRSCIDPVEKLQLMEIPIRGMEMALANSTDTDSMMNEELREVLGCLKVQLGQKFEQAKGSVPFDSTTATETMEEHLDKYLWKFQSNPITQEELPILFFLYCAGLLLHGSTNAQIPDTEESTDLEKQELMLSFKRTWTILDMLPTSQRRQPTFAVTNARAQGTAMGSVYGILCSYIFQRFEDLRLLPLIPWIVFTSFLMHSRMYGQGGGISAVIGALLILGRKNYGRPSEFAIARITEACIGLICFLVVEILLNPERAATLAKSELSGSLEALQDWFSKMIPCHSQKNMRVSTFLALREKQNKLKTNVKQLEKFIAEAELEPNFWFLPFHGSCYGKLLASLSKMTDLLTIVAYQIEFLSQVPKIFGVDIKELWESIDDDLQLFKKKVGSSLKCLKKLTSIPSLVALEKELQKKIVSHDAELGKSANALRLLCTDEEEVDGILSSFLQHLNEETDKIYANECEKKLKSQIVLCLSGLGFCIGNLMRETMEIEKEVKELMKWENPSSHVNLNEISCKINILNR